VINGVAGPTLRKERRAVAVRLLGGLTLAAEAAATATLAALAVVVLLQVASRYVLRAPIDWSVDGATALLIWLSFMGAARAAFDRAHFRVDSLVEILPLGLRRIVAALSNYCAVAVLIILAYFGWRFAMLQMGQAYPGMPIAKGWIAIAIPIGAVLMIPRYLADAVAYTLGRRLDPVSDQREDA
jgi:TRAP-type C4-dicarboxylate transport system permease small subunit